MVKKNISYSLLANIVRLIFGLILFVFLGKILELETFGSYIYILTISGFFTMFIDFGFNLSLLNEIPKHKDKVMNYFYEIAIAKSLLVFIGIVFISLLIYLFDYTDKIVFYEFLIAAIIQSFSVFITTIFKALNRFDIDFYFSLGNNIFPLFLVYIFHNNISLEILGLIYIGTRLINLIILVLYFFKKHNKKILKIIESHPIYLLKKNFKFAIHMVIGGFFLTIDIPIMKEILGYEDVAIYSVGMKFFVVLMMIGDVLNSSFMPRLAEFIEKDKESFTLMVYKLNKLMLFFGLCFSVLIILFGKEIILLIFGDKFIELVDLLPYFSIALFIRYISFPFGTLLTLAEKQSKRAFIMVIVFLMHIGLNIIFQYYFGVVGALIALIISFLVLMFLNMLIVYNHYKTLYIFKGVL